MDGDTRYVGIDRGTGFYTNRQSVFGADGNCSCNVCPYMALNTMEKLYAALRDLTPRIEIEESLRLKAKRSLDRMLEMASGTIGKGDLGARP
jgi:quinolinate synthase